jgi:hypothetical protein
LFELIKTAGFTVAALLAGLLALQFCARRAVAATLVPKLMILTIVTQFAAFCSPTLLVFNVIVALSVPLFATERRLIAPIYIYLLLTLPMVSSFLGTSSLYITAYDVSMSIAFGGLMALLMRSKGAHTRSMQWDLPIFLFFLLLVVQGSRDTTFTNVLRVTTAQTLQVLLPYYVISRSIRTLEDLRGAVFGLVAATAALSVLAAFEALRSWPLFRIIWSHYNIPLGSGASVKLRGGFLRSPGPFPEPTTFANCLAVGVIATYALRSAFRSKSHHLAILAVVVIGIVAPQSRGAWMGAVIGIALFQLFHLGLAKVGQLALFGSIAALAVAANAGVADRISSTLGLGGGPDYRVSLFNRGVEEVKRYPVIGRPIDQVLFSLRDLVQGEGMVDFVNTYLFFALVTGLVGMTVLIITLIWPLVPLWAMRGKRVIARVDQQQIAFVFAGSVSMIVMLTVQSLTGRIIVMITVLMAMGSSVLNHHRVLARGASPLGRRKPAEAPAQPPATDLQPVEQPQ